MSWNGCLGRPLDVGGVRMILVMSMSICVTQQP